MRGDVRLVVATGIAALSLTAGTGRAQTIAPAAGAAAPPAGVRCQAVSARMTETQTKAGCRDGRASCFVGDVDGNQGLRGTTYFHGDSSGTPPAASPTFTPYGGRFEYEVAGGTISMRETGIVSGAEGVVTAVQQIVGGTGDYMGASGRFFVFGTTTGTHVKTTVIGEICRP